MRASVLLAMVLLASLVATAGTLTYQVNFTSNTLIPDCGIVCPPSPLPPGMSDSWSASFQLNSADLAVNGLYDVTSSFTSTKIFFPGTIQSLVTNGSVQAQVTGGSVTDLVSAYQVSYGSSSFDFPVIIGFVSGGGAFRLDTNYTVIKTNISAEDGTFAIVAPTATTPEPATCTLLFVGGLGFLWRKRMSS